MFSPYENQLFRTAKTKMIAEQKITGTTKLAKFAENTLIGLSVGWFLLLFYFLSDGAQSIWDYLSYDGGLKLMVVVAVAFLVLYLMTNGLHVQTWLSLFRRPVFYVVILSFLGTYLTNVYPVSFVVRFRLSQPALENFAEHPTLDHDRSTIQWVGLFPLREVDVAGSAVRMIVSECHLFDDCGFVYSPAGEPPILGEDSYSEIPFAKGWYYWHRSW